MLSAKRKNAFICINVKDITSFNQYRIKQRLLETIQIHQSVVLDMSEVCYMDSAGFAMVADFVHQAFFKDCKVRIVNMKEHLREVVRFLSLDKVIFQ